mgnify:FL=1|tara:strand:- start:90 stop:536 length:447 start_codon:yes stop_codon:yes gene_type:complete
MFKSLFLCLIIILFAFNNAYSEKLIINIESMYDDGYAMLGIYDKKDNFGKAKVNEKPNADIVLTGTVVKITNKKATAIIDIPFGEYAIAGFQDLDGNGVLSGNFLGIPKEPVGFSRNAKVRFGPPKWNDAVFQFNKINQEVLIYLDKI